MGLVAAMRYFFSRNPKHYWVFISRDQNKIPNNHRTLFSNSVFISRDWNKIHEQSPKVIFEFGHNSVFISRDQNKIPNNDQKLFSKLFAASSTSR